MLFMLYYLSIVIDSSEPAVEEPSPAHPHMEVYETALLHIE